MEWKLLHWAATWFFFPCILGWETVFLHLTTIFLKKECFSCLEVQRPLDPNVEKSCKVFVVFILILLSLPSALLAAEISCVSSSFTGFLMNKKLYDATSYTPLLLCKVAVTLTKTFKKEKKSWIKNFSWKSRRDSRRYGNLFTNLYSWTIDQLFLSRFWFLFYLKLSVFAIPCIECDHCLQEQWCILSH